MLLLVCSVGASDGDGVLLEMVLVMVDTQRESCGLTQMTVYSCLRKTTVADENDE